MRGKIRTGNAAPINLRQFMPIKYLSHVASMTGLKAKVKRTPLAGENNNSKIEMAVAAAAINNNI